MGRRGLVDDEQVLLIVDAAQDERLFCYEDRSWDAVDSRRMQRWVRILRLGMKRVHGERMADAVRRAGGLTPYVTRADREFNRDLDRITIDLLTPPTEEEMQRHELQLRAA